MFRHLRGFIFVGIHFSINISFLKELKTVPAAPNIYRIDWFAVLQLVIPIGEM